MAHRSAGVLLLLVLVSIPACNSGGTNQSVACTGATTYRDGSTTVLTPVRSLDGQELDTSVSVIGKRATAFVGESRTCLLGKAIVVYTPERSIGADTASLLARPGRIQMRPVLATLPLAGRKKPCPTVDDGSSQVILCAAATGANDILLPPSDWIQLLVGPVGLTNGDISDASAVLPGGSFNPVGWEVRLTLTRDGAKRFQGVTAKLACEQSGSDRRQLAIVLDGVIESHPQMGDSVMCHVGVFGNVAQITGNYTEREAKDLALLLRFQPLPSKFVVSAS